jgi:serine protease Do
MLKKQIDALGFALMPSRIVFEQGMTRESVMPKGSIGLNALGGRIFVSPAGQVVEYFDYPSIVSVDPDSPAQRAGIVPGDLLLAYDGLDVRGRQFNLTRMLLPDKKLGVTVRHDGEAKEFALTVAKATERVLLRRHDLGDMPGGEMQLEIIRGDGAPRAARSPVAGGRGVGGGGAIATTIMPGGGVFFMSQNTAFGATLSTVGPELARTLKLELGVLVNEVPEESPAFKAGLRTGDVIVNAGGESITSVKALQEVIMVAKRGAEHGVTLQVMREKQPRKVTVSW